MKIRKTVQVASALASREPWVGTTEVAEHIGKPESWVYGNAAKLGIPRRSLGNQWRYRLSEVDAWLDAQAEQVAA